MLLMARPVEILYSRPGQFVIYGFPMLPAD